MSGLLFWEQPAVQPVSQCGSSSAFFSGSLFSRPTLFVGAALGLAAGYFLHNPEPTILAICGMGLLMAAVTHAPFMAALMAVELTGQWHLLAIILPCHLVASLIARKISSDSLYAIAGPEPAQ